VRGEWTSFGDSTRSRLLAIGGETVVSGFAQIKHRFVDELILNAGVRFDQKDRFKGEDLTNVSPRVALIWNPSERFGLAASFAQSFVDAPYWYRYNSLSSYRGGEFLQPEHLRSIQLTPTIRFLDGRLEEKLNVYYQRLSDFIWRNNRALPTEPIYQNAGFLETFGVEEELSYLEPWLTARLNASYQHAIAAENYGVSGSQIHSVPALSFNVVLDVNPLHPWQQQLWLNLTGRYVGPQISPITVYYAGGPDYTDEDFEVDGVFLLNLGARWVLPGLEAIRIDGRIYNLLGTTYFQGGSVEHPYPQAGRWWQLSAIGEF